MMKSMKINDASGRVNLLFSLDKGRRFWNEIDYRNDINGKDKHNLQFWGCDKKSLQKITTQHFYIPALPCLLHQIWMKYINTRLIQWGSCFIRNRIEWRESSIKLTLLMLTWHKVAQEMNKIFFCKKYWWSSFKVKRNKTNYFAHSKNDSRLFTMTNFCILCSKSFLFRENIKFRLKKLFPHVYRINAQHVNFLFSFCCFVNFCLVASF